MLRFLGWIFSWATLGGLMGVVTAWGVITLYSRDLPDTSALAAYQPTMLSRVYSGEGVLMDEFVRERRIFTPIDEIPDLVKHAFISAEDKNFYNHPGFDVTGIAKAIYDAAQGKRLRGASTITQQVMKNFLLDGGRTAERKIKEIILAARFEHAFSKDDILELYLNEPFLGQNSYGVAAAAWTYFDKTLEELTPGEAAYLAALPKAPSELHPVRNRKRAEARRNYVLREMAQNGYLPPEVARAEMEKPLRTVQSGDILRKPGQVTRRDYFTEEIRRQLSQRLGTDKVFGGGLTIRATIDPRLQALATRALRNGLEKRDRVMGKYRGPMAKLPEAALAEEAEWRRQLAGLRLPRDIEGWSRAVVLEVDRKTARIGIEGVEAAEPQLLDIADSRWTGKRRADRLWQPGDVIFVSPKLDKQGERTGWTMRQIPELQGAIMAMDPRTGRVLAMQGGFSYDYSVFNRATQATRQPGSSFKPFVYAAALDRGFTPATIVLDAPVIVDTGGDVWKPENASKSYLGPAPMRLGIEYSRNLMTVRIAQDIGMDVVADYAERFGVYDQMPHLLSYALGAGETTLWRLVAAYGMFANGGLRIEPTLIDRVQDFRGKTIYRHDRRICRGCDDPAYVGQPEPWVINNAERVMDAVTAYQLTSMMRGVVQRGTARVLADLGLNLAGKTGTTNDSRDVWFIGFTPEIVVGCFMGYDRPRPMGRGAYGGTLCAPVVKEFLKEWMKGRGNPDFVQPPGTVLVRMDRNTGIRMPDDATGPNIVTELFRAGEEPEVYAAAEYVVGEGVFSFGNDLPFVTPSEDYDVPIDARRARDVRPTAPPSASQLDLGSGGLY
ncbi:MAG: penicillin-binding protein 1A [Alphaproteobacteria bacterium]|nr:MAG: penicillin-binding protein 1A [Alphaproteobacteria bacterium]